MPDMQSVGSSSIRRAGWDEPDVLYVEFASGGTYRYQGVQRETFDAFVAARSPGQFFHGSIRPYVRGERV